MNDLQPQKILIVRTDRIGDVVLSLPMIEALHSVFPNSSISFLVRTYTQELLEREQHLEQILLYDEGGMKKPFFSMLAEIRRQRFDAVIITYPTARLALLFLLARVPLRVGTGYRWYSFLFNRKVFEHRKTGEKHEWEYNLSLLKGLGKSPEPMQRPVLLVSESEQREAQALLESMHLSPRKPLVILHPGSGGSARDWKPDRFGSLARNLAGKGRQVLLTGGPGEEKLVHRVWTESGETAAALKAPVRLRLMAALLERADAVVANSTGPLHMAAAVGTPVVGFYPPIPQCSARRWGPLAQDKVVFEPLSKDCPLCRGGKCRGDTCMDLISVEAAAEAVETLLHRRHGNLAAVESA